jgi:hypothetical protein
MDTVYYVPVSIVMVYFGYRISRNAYKKLQIKDVRKSRLKRARRKMYYIANIALSTYMFILGITLLTSGLSESIAHHIEPLRVALINPFKYIFN